MSGGGNFPRQSGRALTEFELLLSQLIAAAEQFPHSSRYALLFDQWSIADIIAHLSGWNLITIASLRELIAGDQVTTWVADSETDAFNAQSVLSRQNFSWDDLINELTDTTVELISVYRSLSGTEWQTQLGPVPHSNPLSSLLTDIDHFRWHLAEIMLVPSEYSVFDALLEQLLQLNHQVIQSMNVIADQHPFTYEFWEVKGEAAYLAAWNEAWVREVHQLRSFALRIIEWPYHSPHVVEFKQSVISDSEEHPWPAVRIWLEVTLQALVAELRKLSVLQRTTQLGPEREFTPQFTLRVLVLNYTSVLKFSQRKLTELQN